MLAFYNEHHAAGTQHPPGAVASVLAQFERRGLGRIVTPHGVPLVSLERVHTPRYLHFLRGAWSEWLATDPSNAGKEALPSAWPVRGMRDDVEPADFQARLGLFVSDARTPLTSRTWTAAKTGADCAINAAHALRVGERGSFALTSPPGHHAGADWAGGGGFLNNAALAAQHLRDDGLQRVAILDLGLHHGHGTQQIFYGRSDVLFVSIHLDPHGAYPFYAGYADETGTGAGLGYTMNLPLAAGNGSSGGSSGPPWFAALETACVKLAMFRPEALVVSLGGGLGTAFGLQGGDFLRIGERIAHLGLPTAFMFEDGHGDNAAPAPGLDTVNVLEGFETAA
ncbi:histone deacetylase family protein [Massilia consociata]|uniref:Histone deacetylase family protein n=1 Tax=Massilia consociata TaxID=760117 RepID=A0ABV6FDL9_9BURK